MGLVWIIAGVLIIFRIRMTTLGVSHSSFPFISSRRHCAEPKAIAVRLGGQLKGLGTGYILIPEAPVERMEDACYDVVRD